MYGASLTKVIRGNIVNQTIQYKHRFTKKKRVVDPGIQNRKSLVNDNDELEQLNDYDFDLEADFMNVATTHKQYEYEQNLLKEKEKYLIVKQKYFKQKLPNFLTWSEKEQIRYLHNTNPEEWTFDKLCEGFPALPEVIAKIVKAEWTKTSEHKIQNHDQSVKQNWALFKEGKLNNLPPNVVDHLKQFTNRDQNFKSFEMPDTIKTNKLNSMITPNVKVGSEFSEIIRSYERLKNKDKNITKKLSTVNNSKLQKPPKKDTYLIHDSHSEPYGKQITLGSLQQQVQQKGQVGKISPDEEFILRDLEDREKHDHQEKQFINHLAEAKTMQPTTLNDKKVEKYRSNTEIINTTELKNVDDHVLDYPDSIVIPKNKFKKGYTYKLNDCYYDDDGEFLYRIPGMYK